MWNVDQWRHKFVTETQENKQNKNVSSSYKFWNCALAIPDVFQDVSALVRGSYKCSASSEKTEQQLPNRSDRSAIFCRIVGFKIVERQR